MKQTRSHKAHPRQSKKSASPDDRSKVTNQFLMEASKSPQAMTTPNWPGSIHDDEPREGMTPMIARLSSSIRVEDCWSFDDNQ